MKECDSMGVRAICEDLARGHSFMEENLARETLVWEDLVRDTKTTPGCFLAKSAQRQENAADIVFCELRRVCKRLKRKVRDLRLVAHLGSEQVMTGEEV